jgi:DHA1 family bicyclomycin/chloramphenicol resistance-like MFS transporter
VTAVERGRHIRLLLIVGGITALAPAGMDIYLPGLPGLTDDLGASPSAAQLTVSAYLLGLLVGQLVAGPASDVLGRRRPLLAGLVVFTLASLACGAAPDISLLIVLRFLQGTSGGVGMSVGRAVVRDLYEGANAARIFSRLMLLTGLGPIVAPIVGAQVLRFASWRAVFLVLVGLGACLTVLALRSLPETLAKEARRTGGLRDTFGTFGQLLRDREFLALACLVGFSGAAFLGYVAGSSFALQDVYGASPQLYGLLFGINGAVFVTAAQVNARLVTTRPLERLLVLGGAVMSAAALGFLAVVLLPGVGPIVANLPLTLFVCSAPFIQANAIALALTEYPRAAGAAASLLGVFQFALGAAVAPLVGIGSRSNASAMAVVLIACTSGAVLTLVYRSLRAHGAEGAHVRGDMSDELVGEAGG